MAIRADPSSSEGAPPPPFQFSLRLLLVVTFFVSIVLGLGIHGIPLIAAATAAVFLLRKRKRGWAAGVVVGLLFVTLLGAGTSVEVRLDTGDQRTLLWGIPVAFHPMDDSARRALLSVDDPVVPPRWEWCAQQVGSNNADAMVYRFYYEASAWVDEDPEIAKLVVRDLADYMRSTHARYSLPECTAMIWPDVVDCSQEPARVIDGWKENPGVLGYLVTKGYTIDNGRSFDGTAGQASSGTRGNPE